MLAGRVIIKKTSRRFPIGVQCPEMLVTDDERQAKLLKAFVDAAKEQWANPSDRTIFPPTHVC